VCVCVCVCVCARACMHACMLEYKRACRRVLAYLSVEEGLSSVRLFEMFMHKIVLVRLPEDGDMKMHTHS